MGNPSTVPMFAPDGTLGDIPFEKLMAAKAAGFTPGVTMKTADGQTGIIPATRVLDASKHGLQIVPHEEQEAQQPGFWHSLYSDLVNMAQGAPQAVVQAAPGGRLLEDLLPAHVQKAIGYTPADEQLEGMVERDEARKAAGRSGAYRAVANVGENLGVNASGMEESAAQGDFNGVLGHMAAPLAVTAAGEGLSKVAPHVSTAAGGMVDTAKTVAGHPVAKFAGTVLDWATLDRVSKLYNAYTDLREGLNARKAVYPGAPLPEVPRPELLKANALTQRPTSSGVVPEQAAALAKVGGPTPAAAAPVSIEPMPSGEGLPRTMSGESVLNQVLSGRDNATLLKIARSRGINVTKEAQLKAGAANKLLINKIVDDFSPDELQEVRDQNIENRRFRHAFGDLPEEAWNAMALQTYFPDIKVSEAALKRTRAAVSKSAPPPYPEGDLVGVLQESVKQARAPKLKDLSGQ